MWRIEAGEMQPGNREHAKCSTHGQQINFDKVVKPAKKTREPLNLKREVRGEPVKPKKNAQC